MNQGTGIQNREGINATTTVARATMQPEASPRGEGPGKIFNTQNFPEAPSAENFENKHSTSLTVSTDNGAIHPLLHETVPHITAPVVNEMIDWFAQQPLFRKSKEILYLKGGEMREVEKEIPNPPPQFIDFFREKKIPWNIFKKAKRLIPEFKEACDECEEIVQTFFIRHGLTGGYQSQFGIFAAKNLTKMKDKHEIEEKKVNINKLLDQVERGRGGTGIEDSY